jgi:hypothetical protein
MNEQRARAKAFRAKYEGTCRMCWHDILLGEMVRSQRRVLPR